jgi:hypothetical protein
MAERDDATIRSVPHAAGVLLLWDINRRFWNVQEADDLHKLIFMIERRPSHRFRQGVYFAYEEWSNPIQRKRRADWILEKHYPTSQS